jgi:hypothetical protein
MTWRNTEWVVIEMETMYGLNVTIAFMILTTALLLTLIIILTMKRSEARK